MKAGTLRGGRAEIRAALRESRRLFLSIGLFSVFVNLLMLTGPLFMLQIYDRVLTSRSEPTLVALAGIVAFLFLMMGVLDHARGRVLARAGARFQARLDDRVLGAILTRSVSPVERSRPATGLHDLESMQRFASGPGPFAFFDAPWTPVFLFAIFVFHWMLGILAVLAGVLLLILALVNSSRTSGLQREAGEAAARAAHFIEQVRVGGETVRGLGMRDASLAHSGAFRSEALARTVAASDRNGFYSVISKTLRLFLQSLMLGLGAWLAIRGEVTPGVMIAASILLGRALAPIDQAVGQWPVLQRALQGRRRLAALLAETPEPPARTPLPAPRAIFEAVNLVVVPPGSSRPVVRGASFLLSPGQAIGIAGPSASGKSTLARALAGVWPPAAGKVTLDGADLDQYDETVLGRHIGYLPQEVMLFEGSVAMNIARLTTPLDADGVVEAAKRAGAHEMIVELPGGYDFEVEAGGAALSGGQRQRIALARAFYGSPVVMVLDEPDSHLDADGAEAFARAVDGSKQRGAVVVIVAHRPGTFAQCDQMFLMQDGVLRRVEPEREPAALPALRPVAVRAVQGAPFGPEPGHGDAGGPAPSQPSARLVTGPSHPDDRPPGAGGEPLP